MLLCVTQRDDFQGAYNNLVLSWALVQYGRFHWNASLFYLHNCTREVCEEDQGNSRNLNNPIQWCDLVLLLRQSSLWCGNHRLAWTKKTITIFNGLYNKNLYSLVFLSVVSFTILTNVIQGLDFLAPIHNKRGSCLFCFIKGFITMIIPSFSYLHHIYFESKHTSPPLFSSNQDLNIFKFFINFIFMPFIYLHIIDVTKPRTK